MSIRAIVWAFDSKCPSPSAKLVLIKLADHANDEGECWPSQARVAQDCGLTRETVNRQIKALAAAGLVTVEHRMNGVGQQSNRYVLRCDGKSHPLCDPVTPPCDLTSHPPVISRHTEPLRVEPLSKEESSPIGEPKKTPPVRGTRWPAFNPGDDFNERKSYPDGPRVPPEWRADAYARRPEVDCYEQADIFEDYWSGKAGPNAVKRDWHATWRNWIRNAKPGRPGWKDAFGYDKILHGGH